MQAALGAANGGSRVPDDRVMADPTQPKRAADTVEQPAGAVESENTLKRRKHLLKMHEVGATDGGVSRLPRLSLQEDEPAPAAAAAPRDNERLSAARDELIEERLLEWALSVPMLSQFVEASMNAPMDAKVQEVQREAFKHESSFTQEIRDFYYYIASKATVLFLEERRTYPTNNQAYQTANEAVILRAVRVVLASSFIEATASLNQGFLMAKVRFFRESWAVFEQKLADVMKKLPQDKAFVSQLRDILLTNNKESRAALAATVAQDEGRVVSSLTKLYQCLDEKKFQDIRPLFTDYCVVQLDKLLQKK